MANRKDDRAAKRSSSSTRGGVARRGGFGDEPHAGAGAQSASSHTEHTGPSSQPVSEGLEGAIFSEPDDTGRERDSGRKASAAGRRGTSASNTSGSKRKSAGRGRNTRRS